MEIKINNNGEMLDATIEMVDGVMVVSPKEVKFEPKDGDVFCVDSLYPCVGIVEEVYSYGKPDKDRLYFSVGYWIESGDMQLKTFCACNRNTEPNYRHATEEEKKKFFDKLAEKGYEWKQDTKELVKLKWKPKAGQRYYIPVICNAQFKAVIEDWSDDALDVLYFGKGWAFETKEECQEFCNRLNDAINSVKP